jgi:hypothetical protein
LSATAFQRLRREQEAKLIAEQESEKKGNGFEELKVAELKSLCEEKGIEYDPKARKADLIDLLLAYEAEHPEQTGAE